MLECLTTKPGLIQSRNIDGKCLLHSIVALDKVDILRAVMVWQKQIGKKLIINFDCRDFSHNTPLHLAASSGNVEIGQACCLPVLRQPH